MSEGDIRRTKILEILRSSKQAVTGTELAKQLGVSRQIVVQDIALLRATDKNILSTNKGYILFIENENALCRRRTYKVKHTNKQIPDELNTIVDNGGHILDVVVEHDSYGQIAADLIIYSRADVQAFVEKVEKFRTNPLCTLTDGIHFHTVEAGTEEILDRIELELNAKGYLLK